MLPTKAVKNYKNISRFRRIASCADTARLNMRAFAETVSKMGHLQNLRKIRRLKMIPIKDVDITIPLERYEELITAENQIKLLESAYDLGSYKAEYVLEAMFGKRQENAE